MRQISGASLAEITKTSGVEPVIAVRIYWSGGVTTYCDQKFADEGLVGKLLSISGIEDVVDINQAATSVALTILLDDSDGSIKNIYDYIDIHKTYVQVMQWFKGIPFSDAFIIFEGEISSPIKWSEGARTLEFQVVTKLESTEVGFSAEEGQFSFLPVSLVGKSWPIIFGTVAGSKLLSITEPASCILASGFGVVDEDVWNAELNDLRKAIKDADTNARDAYQLGVVNAFLAGEFKNFDDSFPDDTDQATQYDNAAQNYFKQANDYAEQRIKLQIELQTKNAEFEAQKDLEFRVLPITATNLPTGLPLTVEIANYTANAVVIGSQIILTGLTEKRDVNQRTGTNDYTFGSQLSTYNRTDRGQKFVWIDGGTQIKVFGLPKYYIASVGAITVLNVWAKSKYGRAVVPRNWYTVNYIQYGTLLATQIVFPTPITSYPGEWQDSDIEIDAVSALSSNTVDIMTWAIQNFSTLAIDTDSFADVRAKVDPFRANFVLTNRKDVVTFLKEVAFQSRCAIWINDRKFFLRFLPEELNPVESINDNDVEVDSIVVTATDTERLVTKFTALWRANQNQAEDNKIIYRYNLQKYGMVEEEYSFYIYNQYEPVSVAAQFWMIRKANTWKRITCKVLLHKLRIETFDVVQFDFSENLVAVEPVNGIVERATFDPDEDSITLEAWLPVRLGEMRKYNFAFPYTVQDIYPQTSDPNIITGNPYEASLGILAPPISFPPYTQFTFNKGTPYTQGRGEVIADSAYVQPANVITALDPRAVSTARPAGINAFNNEKKYTVNPIAEFNFKQVLPATFFGDVIAKEENSNSYRCRVWLNGFDQDFTEKVVKIGFIREGSILPEGYPLYVVRTIYTTSNGTQSLEFWAQPALWFPSEEEVI